MKNFRDIALAVAAVAYTLVYILIFRAVSFIQYIAPLILLAGIIVAILVFA